METRPKKRYSYDNGVRKLWVYADDKPHDPTSSTQPRTEIRIRVIYSLLKYIQIDVNAVNAAGHTAMDVLTLARSGINPVCPSDVCVKCLRRAEDLIKFDWLQRRDILMVVVAYVVAAMTFDAAENPPGGVWQDDKDGHKAKEK
ncbi:hypothetical protein CsSME_00035201 [Camellia sinensis var. sinensis]